MSSRTRFNNQGLTKFFKAANYISKNIDNSINIIDSLVESISYINEHTPGRTVHVKGKAIYKDIVFDAITFSNFIFYEEVIFENCEFSEEFRCSYTEFKKEVSFKRSVFNSKARFIISKFNNGINFENTQFNSLVDFYYSVFEVTQQFYLTDFFSRSIFSNVTFNGQVQFLYNNVSPNTILSFENAFFNKALDISRSNFWCKIQFWGADFDWDTEELWLYQSDNIKKQDIPNKRDDDFFNKFKIGGYKKLRESCRIIKQNFKQEGNNIEAIRFYKEEMHLYSKELAIKGYKTSREEKIILWFNKWSNFFGISWWRGIRFTFCVSVLFYFIFLWTCSNYLYYDFSARGVNNFLTSYFQFLNITDWKINPFNIGDLNGGYIILFIGRIFIGYGYYQMIQAFRKYGKE
jgi:predicted metal-binding protein